MKKVFIVNGSHQYERMFKNRGWIITDDLREADLVQFTGGADVTPSLYDEARHPRTGYNASRDEIEKKIYHNAQAMGIPCAGICRGGQFLNVMNGGKMWQDVDNHAVHGTHPAFALGHIGWVSVTSTHHQMIRPNEEVDHLLLMTANLSTRRERMSENGEIITFVNADRRPHQDDVESVYYPETNTLCYQPHPEFSEGQCQDVYFYFLNNYLMNSLNIGEAITFSRAAWKSEEVE